MRGSAGNFLRLAAGGIGALVLAACTTRATDRFQASLNNLSLKNESVLTLVSNSTTQSQPMCAQSNQVVIEENLPAGQAIYCRDRSKLDGGFPTGPVCPGGVSILPFSIPANPSNSCSQLTLCGVAPASTQVVGQRTDGGKIVDLTFRNLPWGCDGEIDLSYDSGFTSDATMSLTLTVQPPPCPFCLSQFQTTCLACAQLGPNQTVVDGQIVDNSCAPNCAACPVLNNTNPPLPPGTPPFPPVAHGQAMLYYQSPTGTCGHKCAQESAERVCNNGLWKGDPSYTYPMCIDTPCPCTLPGNPVTFSHGSSTTIYQSASPACGIACASQSLQITCNDGTWVSGSPATPVSAATFQQYPAVNGCTKRVCPCPRPGRATVPDGGSLPVYLQSAAACGQTCTAGAVSCKAGVLSATDPTFLTYPYDSCTPSNCSCTINLPTGPITVKSGKTQTFYQYTQNTYAVPDACINASYQVTIMCVNGVIEPAGVNLTPFPYTACTTNGLSCSFTDAAGKQVSLNTGQSAMVTLNPTPACGTACQNLSVMCNNGVLMSGGSPISQQTLAGYYNQTCTQTQCAGCTTPWGLSVISGAQVTAFAIRNATCAAPNACTTAPNFQTSTCNNGTFQPALNATGFPYATCAPAVCYCSYAGIQVSITPPQNTLTVYSTQSPPAGESCNSFSAVATCNPDTTWSGVNFSQYPYTTCSDDDDQGSGGGTGGGTGDDQGPGSGIKNRMGLGDGGGGGGGPCLDFEACRLNRTDIGVAAFTKEGCVLPWGGGEVEFYATIPAFTAQCVVSPDHCSNHRVGITCQFPSWTTGSQSATSSLYPSCVEKAVCP
jgi:hypothetical protein